MNAIEFSVKGERLFVGGESVGLPYIVGDVVACGSLLLVRVEPPIGVIFNRNIFAVTRKGEIVWQIAESPHGTEAEKPYVGIFRAKDGGVVVSNWNGVDYLVDLECGSIAAKAFNK
ncbi:hypothetical protein [Pseudomonas sp. PMCC200344]|uniref:hypothetical protein n=1 Tax=Pseudomonas sp. PMCC200344 TaxID=3042028 RepID=UPI0024B32EC1|nr:hypothetical protein [Pseudomonas sp. PMCC200344]